MSKLPNTPQPVIKFRFHTTVGVDITTGFHTYFATGGPAPSVPQLASILSLASNAYAVELAPFAHPSTILTSIDGVDLSSDIGSESSVTANHPGTRAGGMLPANACALVNATINRRYRGGKPRFYLPLGTDSDLLNPQQWTSAFVTGASGAFTNFVVSIENAINGNIGGAAGGLVNVSYYEPPPIWYQPDGVNWKRKSTKRPVPVIDNITGTAVSSILGSQRRRVRGR